MPKQNSMNSDPTRPNPNGGQLADAPQNSMGDMSTMRAQQQRRRYNVGDVLLGRYRITGELGQGGMGVVFRCFDEVGGIDVALKALPPELSHNSVEMEEVRDNFRLIENLHHPNIAAAKTLERDSETGDYYLVMECIDGINLRKWRKQRGGRLSPHEALPILRQVAEALDYAHSRQIIHRDIKPSNVMVSISTNTDPGKSGTTAEKVFGKGPGEQPLSKKVFPADLSVKVLDFGLAAQIHTSMSRVSMVNYGTSGTGPYMAPEQWRGRNQGKATDQYALAVTAYELLAGHLPFENPDPTVLRGAVIEEAPEPIEALDKNAWAAIETAMAKDPDDRFASCSEFINVLASGKKPRNTRKALKGGATKTNRTGQKNPVLKVLSVLIVLIILAAAGWYGWQKYEVYSTRQALQQAIEKAEAAKVEGDWTAVKNVTQASLPVESNRLQACSTLYTRLEDLAQTAAEQQELASAQHQQITELEKQTQTALSRNDLKTAGETVSKLESLNAPAGMVADLRSRLESKANAREVRNRYGEASVAYDKLKAAGLDRGQGFGDKLDQLDARWKAARSAHEDEAWGEALTAYDEVLAKCAVLERLQNSRRDAEERREEAAAAKRSAAAKNAAADASSLFGNSGHALSRAEKAFEAGNFEAAGKHWQTATEKYNQARDRALAVQAYREAKQKYEEKLADHKALLKEHGGEKWEKALEQSRIGAVSADAPEDGRKAYEKALVLLPDAVAEAQSGKQAAERERRRKDAGQRMQAAVDAAQRLVKKAKTREGAEARAVYAEALKILDIETAYLDAANRRKLGDLRAEIQEAKGPVIEGPEKDEDWRVALGGGESITLKWIPPGTFMLGSTKEEREWAAGPEGQGKAEWFDDEGSSPRRCRIEKGFWMGQTEVTVKQWKEFIKDTGYKTDAEKRGEAYCMQDDGGWGWVDGKSWRDPNWYGVTVREDHPVACISWNDAVAFCKWLTEKERKEGCLSADLEYRLPGEAEWEYACRGGRDGGKFWWGDSLADGRGRLNGGGSESFKRPGGSSTSWPSHYPWDDGHGWAAPVETFGAKGRNGYGLSDMLGNVWEWCYDWYDDSGAQTSTNTRTAKYRILRGGSFRGLPGTLRCALRVRDAPSRPYADLGFRVCLGVVVSR